MAAEQLLGFDIEDDSSEVQFSIHAANLGDGYVRRGIRHKQHAADF